MAENTKESLQRQGLEILATLISVAEEHAGRMRSPHTTDTDLRLHAKTVAELLGGMRSALSIGGFGEDTKPTK